MIARLLLVIIAMPVISISGYCQNTVVGNPVVDFINFPGVSDADFTGRNKSDVIYRLDLDLYKNGRTIVFLTYKAWGSRTGHDWVAYAPVKGGYARVTETVDDRHLIEFRPDGWYSVGRVPGYFDEGGLYVVYPGKGGGELVRYDIRDGAATVHHLRTLGWGDPDDMKLVEAVLGHKLDDPKFAEPICQVLSASAIRAGMGSH